MANAIHHLSSHDQIHTSNFRGPTHAIIVMIKVIHMTYCMVLHVMMTKVPDGWIQYD